jgi:electron transfer flavoprotein alpha subunit
MRDVLAVMEIDEEASGVAPVSLELLECGKLLSRGTGGTLCAVLIGNSIQQQADEIAKYADKVYVIDHTLLKDFNPELYVYVLERVCERANPAYIILAHTWKGADIAPRLSARLRVPLTTDCIGLALDNTTGLLKRRKQVYGGAVVATFIYEDFPQLVTLRPKVWEKVKEAREGRGEIIHLDLKIDESLSKLKVIKRIKEETVKLADADAIVAGGRGVGSAEGFKELEKLKAVLEKSFNKVEIGASRPPVDKGWISPSRQIGLTGEKVSPTLYIAVGISGATQHVVGMDKSKIIVAINNDPNAYIFSIADIGVVGDYREILPHFIKGLEEFL